jgi:large subunit ribosomal protein L21
MQENSSQYAIIETGGKQYRVQKGDTINVELIEPQADAKVSFDQVLLLHNEDQILVGTPNVAGCTVLGELLGIVKGEKVIAYKYKKRKNYRRTVGHRQKYSNVKITDIKIA